MPARGDLVAALSVALVLVPQSLAYAELAGTPVVNGLYTAAVAAIAAGFIGSSPYLQTGPTAATSLLTFGALAPIVTAGTENFAAHAALLALVVGAVRLLLGLFRWGVVAYLMSQPVVSSFTVAAAILIVSSQVPALLGVRVDHDSPLVAAGAALGRAGEWDLVSLGIGAFVIAVMLLGRRVSPLFPGALVATVVALGASALGWVSVAEVGRIPDGLPPLSAGLPWDTLGSLLVPGLVIALVGFAEPASIARRYAAEDRRAWDADREFVGQGLANLASGAFSGYPVGGSFSRTALGRLSGARTRWSGALTGVVVLAVMPVASVLSSLPKAALAGLVMASVFSLLEVRPFRDAWRFSRPQFFVALPTFVATLVAAPRVERGVLVGVALALAVHLWRELRLELEVWTTDDTLHVRPQGVLYFASAPSLETRVMSLMADAPDLRHVVVHLDQLGRLDLTGALVLRSLVEDMESSDATVTIEGTQPQARRLVSAVLGLEPRSPADPPEAPDRVLDEPSVVCEPAAGSGRHVGAEEEESHGSA